LYIILKSLLVKMQPSCCQALNTFTINVVYLGVCFLKHYQILCSLSTFKLIPNFKPFTSFENSKLLSFTTYAHLWIDQTFHLQMKLWGNMKPFYLFCFFYKIYCKLFFPKNYQNNMSENPLRCTIQDK